MKSPAEVEERLGFLRSRLNVIEDALSAEMRKAHPARNGKLLDFLYKERSVYCFSLAQLEWVVSVISDQ
jgi:hypothetical protein